MQFVDDVLDFTGSTLQLGKPALNDLHSGLATAPVLFAAEEHPQVCFRQPGSTPKSPLFCNSPQPGALLRMLQHESTQDLYDRTLQHGKSSGVS